MDELESMKKDPYLLPPEDYEPGKDVEEDEKYHQAADTFNSLVEEIYKLEQAGREGN